VVLAYLGCLLYAWAEMERLNNPLRLDPDKTPLVLAAQQGDYASARQLLESGEDPNQQPDGWGPTPLLMSIAMGDIPMIDLLLHSGADIEKWGRLDPAGADVLPLDYACMYRGRGRVGVVIFLLMSGADIDGSGIQTCENHYNQNIMDIKHVAQDWKAEGRSIKASEAELTIFIWEVFHVVFHGYDADFDWDHGLYGLLQGLETLGSASEI